MYTAQTFWETFDVDSTSQRTWDENDYDNLSSVYLFALDRDKSGFLESGIRSVHRKGKFHCDVQRF